MRNKERYQPEIIVNTEYDPSRGGYFAHIISIASEENGAYTAIEVLIPGNTREAAQKMVRDLERRLPALDNVGGLNKRDKDLLKKHWPGVIEFLKNGQE